MAKPRQGRMGAWRREEWCPGKRDSLGADSDSLSLFIGISDMFADSVDHVAITIIDDAEALG
jgi:hypothetical protein